jgi:tRNA U54 and U55 pseudouridine synthase Pus10
VFTDPDLGELAPERRDLNKAHTMLRNSVVERLSMDQLDREELDVPIVINGKERNDVRMVERRDGASFLLEAREPTWISGPWRRAKL